MNQEFDDPVKAAEEIIKQAKENKPQSFNVKLPVDVLYYLMLNLELPLMTKHLEKKEIQDKEGIFHEENLLSMLNEKFTQVFKRNKKEFIQLDQRQKENMIPNPEWGGGFIVIDFYEDSPRIDLELNEREVELLNRILLDDKHRFQYIPDRKMSDEEIGLYNLRLSKAALVELNQSFMSAGGKPRPEFVQYFEGMGS